MFNIIEKIVSTPEREKGGSTAFNRFSYQNNWALCHLLEMHDKGQDYILSFECHDDVLEIEHSNPPKLKFYQIKTKRNGALKIANAKESKYLGKLYCNYLNFPNETSGLFLVSNNSFIANLKSGESIGLDKIKLTDIKSKDLTKIENYIKSELDIDNVKFDLMTLIVSKLHLDSHRDDTLGAITRFLNKLDKSKASIPFHQALSDEIARRAEFENYNGNIKEFIAKKSISREQFDKYLNQVVLRPDFEEKKAEIRAELLNDGLSYTERKAILDNIRTYEIDLLSPSNDSIEKITNSLKKIIAETPKTDSNLNFSDTINKIYEISLEDDYIKSFLKQKGNDYIKAIIAVELSL